MWLFKIPVSISQEGIHGTVFESIATAFKVITSNDSAHLKFIFHLLFQHNAEFSSRPCETCLCDDGDIKCSNRTCPALACKPGAVEQQLPGECCRECVPGGSKSSSSSSSPVSIAFHSFLLFIYLPSPPLPSPPLPSPPLPLFKLLI